MDNREEVLKGLECCFLSEECADCPYNDYRKRYEQGRGLKCTGFLANDAFDLLQRQVEADRLMEVVEQVKAGLVKRFAGDGFEVIGINGSEDKTP